MNDTQTRAKKGKLIILCAPSGAGKSTLVQHLLKRDLNLELSVSACSRDKRDEEVEGRDYYFIKVEEFKKKIEAREFLEWEEVYPDQFYGTLKSEVNRILDTSKNIVFDVDVVGGLNIKKEFGDQALSIFIMPPSIEELRKRLLNRGTETEETLARRVDKATQELEYKDKFDVTVVNDDLEKAKKELEEVVRGFLNS